MLGEYAILQNGRALLLAHGPNFDVTTGNEAGNKPAFHPESAAGKASRLLHINLSTLKFRDPHQGKGGFGGSGAEFLSVLAAKKNNPGNEAFAWEAWDLYKKLGCSGSGADLLAQGSTKSAALLSVDLNQRKLGLFPLGKLGIQATLFHTGRKLPTHVHLEEKSTLNVETLTQIADRGIMGCSEGKTAIFLESVRAYGKELARLDLVAGHSAAALKSLDRIKEVLAAKGCGAMGSDVLLVCSAKKIDLSDWSEYHSLVEVASLPI